MDVDTAENRLGFMLEDVQENTSDEASSGEEPDIICSEHNLFDTE